MNLFDSKHPLNTGVPLLFLTKTIDRVASKGFIIGRITINKVSLPWADAHKIPQVYCCSLQNLMYGAHVAGVTNSRVLAESIDDRYPLYSQGFTSFYHVFFGQ